MNENKNTCEKKEKKTFWQWLQALIRILLIPIANMDRTVRTSLATTDTCKTSPPWEGSGEALREAARAGTAAQEAVRSGMAAQEAARSGKTARERALIVAPANVTFGPHSSKLLSRCQLLSLLRSDCQASSRKIDMVVLHCSDTRPSQQFTIEKLRACHKARPELLDREAQGLPQGTRVRGLSGLPPLCEA